MANYVYADTNTDLDLTFETENLGQISASGTTADYGSLTATPTNLLANTPLLAESDIDGDRGEIVNQSISPMGAVASMTSTTNEAFARTSYLGSGNIAASGIAGQSLKRIWIGSGTIFEISDGMERSSAFWLGSGGATFDGAAVETFNAAYNTDSDLLLSDDDYGTIEPLHEGYLQNQKALLGQALYFPTPDSGSITEPFSEGEEDYGSIVFGQRRRTVHDIQTVEAARGKFTLGERKETGLRYQTRTTATGIPDMPINRYEWVGSGFSHIIGGEVSERYKPTFGQTGSGLFAITGTVAESTGFEAQGESADFPGQLIQDTVPPPPSAPPVSPFPPSYIHTARPKQPRLGRTFLYNRRAIPWNGGNPNLPYSVNLQIFLNTPNYPQGVDRHDTAGKRKTNSWLGSGSLFSLGGAVETATFHQSQDSVNLFSTEDYDLITASAPNPDEDYGTTTEGIPQGAVDHGHIGFSEDVFGGTGGPRVFYVRDLWTQEEIDEKLNINPQYVTPETGLVPQVGVEKTQEESEDVQYKPIFGQFGTGLFSVSGTATEKVIISGDVRGSSVFPGQLIQTNSFGQPKEPPYYIHTRRPSQPRLGRSFLYNTYFWNPNFPIPTYRFYVAGVKQTDDYVGSGSLFSVGGAAESATFDYNEDTVVVFTTDDNGLITASGSIVNHGEIIDPLTEGIDDNGSILNTFTVSAVTGSLFAVGGAAESTTTNPPEDTYLFSVVGQGIEKQTDDYIGSGSATLSGSGLDAVVFREVFSGTLSSVGGAVEAAAFDYNLSSIVTFATPVDNGLITGTAPNPDIDYGFITDPLTEGIDDLGSIIYSQTVQGTTGGVTFAYQRPSWTQAEIDERLNTNPDYVTPETGLVPVAGQEKTQEEAGDVQFKPIFAQIGSGSLFAIGGAVETVAQTDDTFGLFTLFTAPAFIGNTYRFCWNAPFVEGGLFSIGGAAESATWDYNETSIVVVTTTDNGLITNSVQTTEDNGSVASPLTDGEENNGTIVNTVTTYPLTGTLATSGVAETPFTRRFIGSGSISTFSGQALVEKVTFAEEATYLFNIVGTTAYARTRPYIGSGIIPSVGGGVEKVTFDYGEQVVFTSDDYGNITATTTVFEDSGLVSDPLTAGEEDYNTILYNQTVQPYAGGTGPIFTIGYQRQPLTQEEVDEILAGNPDYVTPETGLVPQAGDIKTQEQARDVKFEPIFSQIGSGSLFSFGGAVEAVAQTDDTFGLFNVSGSTVFSRTRPYIGSGSLFTLNGAAEAVTWDYNETSIDVVTTEDYGNVVDSVTTTDDYGSVTETTTAGEFTYGTIVNTSTTFPLTGSYVVSGDSVEKNISRETGGGTFSTFSGQALVEKVTFAEEATGLFDIVGVAQTPRTRDYVGTGSLFGLSGCAEAVTWDYNETSIDVFSTEDNGLISSTATVLEDNGLISDPLTAGEENNGTVINTATTYPLTGTIDLTGVAETPKTNVFIGSGSLFTASGAAEIFVLDYESTYLFTVVGTTAFSRSRDYVGSGSLFSIGGCVEKVTFDYNDSSVVVFSSVDNGLVTGTAPNPDVDHGTIVDPLSAGEENNGTVLYDQTVTGTTGGITLSGEVVDVFAPIFAEVGSGSLFSFGGAAESVSQTDETTGLFSLSTSPAFIGNTYRFCWKYDAFGTLPVIGGAAESRTYDYSDELVLPFVQEDNGENGILTFTNTSGNNTNFSGLGYPVGSGYTTVADTGSGSGCTVNVTSNNQDGTITGLVIEGAGTGYAVGDRIKIVNKHEGLILQLTSQSSWGADGSRTPGVYTVTPTASMTSANGVGGLFTITIASDGSVSSATLPSLSLGGGIDKRGENYVDFELITIPGSTFGGGADLVIEVGLATTDGDRGTFIITSVGFGTPNLTEDDGSINLPTTAGEEDNGSILNTVITPAQGTYTTSGAAHVVRLPVWVGSGTLFTAGGAAETVAQTDDTTGLFTVSGVVAILRTHAFNGSGTLNALSGAAESRTWVYDRDLPDTLTSEDYGSVDANATSNEDQGQITNPLTDGEEDYGADGNLAHILDPAHGTYTISGVALTPFERKYTGSGSASFSGTAIERFARFGEIDGAGTIELFTAPAFIGNTYRFTFRFTGSGNLFTAGGLVESTTTNPPERTILFTGSGTAGEKQTDRYIGSGNLFTAGGVADTVTFNEAATGLFTVSGVGIEKHTERYVGTATAITLSGTAVERATQDYTGDTAQYTLSGNAVERQTDDYVGSGSLFTASGSAEAITSNPPEDTALFVVGGTTGESFTPATEIGSGSFTTVGGHGGQPFAPFITERVLFATQEATGLYTVSGQVEFNYIVSHIGSGSLFTTGGAAESKTTNIPESTIIFAATGTVAESTTVIAVVQGGTLSTFSGQALIEKVGVAEEATGLYTIGGAVEFIYRVRYPGSGNLFTAGGAAEAVGIAEESTGLYQLQGTGNEAFARTPYIGSGSYGGFSGTRVSEKHTEAYLGDAPEYTWSGFATLSVEYHFDGEGNLFTASGASESITTNPPEDTALFTVAGTTGDPTIVKDYVGSGSYGGFSGTCVEKVAQADEMGGTITLSGDVIFNIKYMPVVGGNIFTFGGAAERVTSNPPENIALFALGGTKDEAFSPAPYIGSGSTSISGFSIEKHTERYVGDVAEFTIGGTVGRVIFTPNNIGSGSIFVTGDGVEKQTDRYIGSGNLFTAGGAVEVITTNPPESTVLFVATGQSIEKHTERYVGSGSATLSGSAVEKHSNGEVGSGSLFTVGGAAESVTFNEAATGLYGFSGVVGESFIANPPESTAQITLSGEADDRQLDNYTGTGVMDFLEGGAAVAFAEERIAFSPDATGLFALSGESTSAVVRPHIGSGTISTFSGQAINEKVTFADDETLQIQLSGESVSKFTGSFAGSGSLFTTGGAAESKTTNESESIILFRITGTADTPRARAYNGSGSISITGSTVERSLRAHAATGSLFAFNGVADTVTFNYSATGLFGVSGGANEAFIRLGYQGSGSTTISGTSDESQTDRYVGDTAQYNISGAATEIRFIPHYKGSGSLFTTGGVAVLIAQTDDTTGLFEISLVRERWTQAEVDEQLRINSNYVTPETGLAPVAGDEKTQEQSGDVKYIPIAAHTGSGTVNLDGTADEEFRKFEPGFTFVTII